MDRLRQRPQADRLPRRPAALDPPDRRRQRRPARGRGQLRHDHLRQGRLGAQAARRLGRPGRLRRRHPAVLQGPRVRQHRVLRPARRPGEVVRSRAGQLGHRVAADRRREHPRAGLRARCRRQLRVVLDRSDRAPGLADAAPPPPRHRPVRRRGRPARPPGVPRGRRRGCLHHGRRAGGQAAARAAAAQRRGPRLRQDPPRRALARHGDRRPVQGRGLAGPGPRLGRRVGHDPRRRDGGDRLGPRSCWPTSAPRPTPGASPGSRPWPPPPSYRYSDPAAPRRPEGGVGAGHASADARRRARQRPAADLRPHLLRRRPQRCRRSTSWWRSSTVHSWSRASPSTRTSAGA